MTDCCLLSYISFLHQTTTMSCMSWLVMHCLISLFYIKPQLLDKDTRMENNCLISLFYIKPQLVFVSLYNVIHCLISLFYIKPQLIARVIFDPHIVLYLFSTSNHNRSSLRRCGTCIVLYLFSTSNHNYTMIVYESTAIVLYLFSTSNHNYCTHSLLLFELSYISFLHQTTTGTERLVYAFRLSYISFLHQTTTLPLNTPS